MCSGHLSTNDHPASALEDSKKEDDNKEEDGGGDEPDASKPIEMEEAQCSESIRNSKKIPAHPISPLE